MSGSRPARYEEIADYVRGLAAARPAGDRLPSDADLCERFGVSRMTARHAVEVVAAEGHLYRRRGQGTFVASRPIARVLGSPLSFTESMRRRGLRASSRMLVAELREAEAGDAGALGLATGERVVLVERLRFADGIPMAIEHAVLHPRLAAVLDRDLESESLHAAVEGLGRVPTRARAQVTARPANARERRLLELGASGVLLCERRVITDQDGAPLEHTETRYAAGRYVFEAVFERGPGDVVP